MDKYITGIGKWIGDTARQLGAIALVLYGIHFMLGNHFDRNLRNQVDAENPLQADEKARFTLKDGDVIVQRKGEKTKVYPSVRRGTLTQMESGELEAKIKTKGFVVEPGLTIYAGDGLRLGLDVQYAYWKRWGLLAGITVPATKRSIHNIRAHAGVSYDIPNRFFRTSAVWGGVDTRGTPAIGLRTRF